MSVLKILKVIRLAKDAGLNLDEVQTLLHDLPEAMPPSERWAILAKTKFTELNERMAQLKRMKATLEKTLACECPTLDECGMNY